MYDNTSRVIEVDINDILPNRFQPRIQFDEEEILELSDSIKEHGVIQPIVVRMIGDKYEIIAGERRYKASVLAGKESVPVIIKNLNDKESAEIALIENVQRRNLTPIEEALSYKKLLDMGYITQDELAKKIGKSQSSVANKIRLLNLSDDVQESLLENKISERHARSLLRLPDSSSQNEILKRIIDERLTVRKTDELIDQYKTSSFIETNKEEKEGESNMYNEMPNNFLNPQPTNNLSNQSVQSNMVTPNFDIFSTQQSGTDSGTNSTAGGLNSNLTIPTAQVVQPQSVVDQPLNNMFNFEMPSVEQATVTQVVETPTVPNFDIFSTQQSGTDSGTNSTSGGLNSNLTIPTVQAVESQSTSTPNFDIFTQQQPVAAPTVEPQSSVLEQPKTQNFDVPAQQPATSTPAVPNFDIFAQQPTTVSPVVETPAVPNFDTFAQEPQQLQPASVPETAPILEQSTNNMFNFELPTLEPTPAQEPQPVETKSATVTPMQPEPIIVTDYNKQYDPIMPNMNTAAPVVDFKEVINAIRECSNKIEQYGFKLDVEEYDLANIYQVVFKIEK